MARMFGSFSAASDGYSQISQSQQARSAVLQTVKYTGRKYDSALDVGRQPSNIVFQMPHYRARNQPLKEPLKMAVRAADDDLQITVTRVAQHVAFRLQVDARSSDIAVWLPSDFHGAVFCNGKVAGSPAFYHHVLPNIRLNETFVIDEQGGVPLGRDFVSIQTSGNVMFRVWDVRTGKAERTTTSTVQGGCDVLHVLRKVGQVFGCVGNKHERYYNEKDWDWLVDN